MNVGNITDIRQEKQLQYEQTTPVSNIDNNDILNKEIISSMDYSDIESDDDDLELLKTLSQFHGIINPSQSLKEIELQEQQLSSYSPDINEEKPSSHFFDENRISNGNETELLNKKEQIQRCMIPTTPYVIDTIKQSDEEQEEKKEKNNVIFHKNHNDVDGDDTQKEKYEKRAEEEEEKKATTAFSLTSSTSPILFNDESHSSVVFIDPDTSSLLTNLLSLPLNHLNETTLYSNQLTTDDLQTKKTKSNMNQSPDEQTTSNLFDPFAPTTTTTNMFDEISTTTNENSAPPLANFNFDDLWNQSMSHTESSNKPTDPNTFTWDNLVNNNPTPTNLTWESLFGEEEKVDNLKEFLNWIVNHLNDSETIVEFTSTQNLESIVKDVQMSTLPFEPIPSPPLHVDHTVTNPLINATHHDLFPIDELEQPNLSERHQSMTLYEEDEEDEEEANTSLSFDDQVKPIIDKLVSDTLESALTEVNESYQQVEHFVDQILAEAIFEVYHEDQISDENIPIENLATIISWHDQTKATNNQIPDPFDQTFDRVWSSHFQAPDDTTNENLFEEEEEEEKKDVNDPWLMTNSSETTKDQEDPISFFSKTFDDTDLFSSSKKIEDNQTSISDYLPPPILTNTSNDLMKYSITAPVIDDSGDDTSNLEDYFSSQKVITPVEFFRFILIFIFKSFW